MNLGKQIHALLKRQPEVFVQNLGTFKRIHTSASFDEKRQVYLPPLTYIEFDKEGTSGYDFVQYVQQVNQIERLEAESLVDDAVVKLNDEIAKSGQALLDSLGHLVNFGNSYVFKPLDLSGFNYSVVEESFIQPAEPIIEDTIVESSEQPEQVTEAPVVHPTEVEIEELVTEPVVVTEEKVTEEAPVVIEPSVDAVKTTIPEEVQSFEHEERKSKTGVYIFLALLAVAILGAIYYYNTYMNKPLETSTEELYGDVVDSSFLQKDTTVVLDSNMMTADTAQSQIDTVSANENKPAEALTEKEEVKKFTIIIGTHKTLAQAYEQAEAFHKDGHKSVRVVTPNLAKNRKRVIWDTYATKEERDSAIRYVQKHIIADAWPDVLK